MNLKNIPEELRNLPNWFCYKLELRENGKYSKMPREVDTGKAAKWTENNGYSFSEALGGLYNDAFKFDGIGFLITGDNNIFGVDLDGVIDEAGNVTPEAKEIVDLLDSYTEISPSGKGLHIICKGSFPDGGNRNELVEMYKERRFLTVTGDVFGTLKPISERSEQATALHNKLFSSVHTEPTPKASGEPVKVADTDQELLGKMFNSSNGADIRRLWDGDISGYKNDHSTADLALVRYLAYWTNGDAKRIDNLFRASGLMRPKWDRKTGNSTYGANTINFVLKNFSPYTRAEQSPIRRTTAKGKELYNLDKEEVSTMLAQEAPPVDLNIRSAADYLKSTFKDDRAEFQGFKERKTGFKNIDENAGGLYPGLYVIGAQSSLGKTTFIHQIGDQLAEAGDSVLFFSLEQSIFELTTKSLARESFKIDTTKTSGAISAIQIRRGGTGDKERLNTAYKNYLKYADNMLIKECNFDENIDGIANTVEQFIARTNIKPIVIIDYLQIIPASDPRMSDKEKTDQHIRRLKILQRKHDLVLFVISSLNRANYKEQVSFESFKESGGIEYTADVVWGLDYSVVHEEEFTKAKTTESEKRNAIQNAKVAMPRKIVLNCIKNRYGTDYKVHFNYYPKYDYFEPTTDSPIETKRQNRL